MRHFTTYARELGPNPDIILNEARKGSLFDYIEAHRVPAYSKKQRLEWRQAYTKPFERAKTDAELYDDSEPMRALYEIRVNGEFYGYTSTLEFSRVCETYPHFRELWWREKVDVLSFHTQRLVQSNYQSLNPTEEDNDTQ